MKPNVNQRIEIYNLMLTYFIKDQKYIMTSGFCAALDKATDYGNIFSNDIKNYPELMKHKPRFQYGNFWFTVTHEEGRQERIRILKKILDYQN